MPWNVEYTDEFEAWWKRLSEEEQISIDATVRLLETRGPKCWKALSNSLRIRPRPLGDFAFGRRQNR